MGYAVYTVSGGRDAGYGVPAWCDHPDCDEKIDRGLGYCCGGEPGGEFGCGLYFCSTHLWMTDKTQLCDRCIEGGDEAIPFDEKPDHPEWVQWKLTDDSWAEWREGHPEAVAAMRAVVSP